MTEPDAELLSDARTLTHAAVTSSPASATRTGPVGPRPLRPRRFCSTRSVSTWLFRNCIRAAGILLSHAPRYVVLRCAPSLAIPRPRKSFGSARTDFAQRARTRFRDQVRADLRAAGAGPDRWHAGRAAAPARMCASAAVADAGGGVRTRTRLRAGARWVPRAALAYFRASALSPASVFLAPTWCVSVCLCVCVCVC